MRPSGDYCNVFQMPKMKSHSGAKKRFKVTATGKVRGRSGNTSHILEKKPSKRRRRQRQAQVLTAHDRGRVKRMLGEQ